jgi:CRP-like cAMP-binding protein
VLNWTPQDVHKFSRISDDIRKDKTEWYIEVVRLTTGSAFGEKALIEDAPRAASITAI